jgi:hypothetical protein
VVLGGGQDAMNVTMTDRRAGKFEAKFYHKVIFSSQNINALLFLCYFLLTLHAYNI